jgi:hypothetical protein
MGARFHFVPYRDGVRLRRPVARLCRDPGIGPLGQRRAGESQAQGKQNDDEDEKSRFHGMLLCEVNGGIDRTGAADDMVS